MEKIRKDWLHVVSLRRQRKMTGVMIPMFVRFGNQHFMGKIMDALKQQEALYLIPDNEITNVIRLNNSTMNGFHELEATKIHINYHEANIELQFSDEQRRDFVVQLLRKLSAEESPDSGAPPASSEGPDDE